MEIESNSSLQRIEKIASNIEQNSEFLNFTKLYRCDQDLKGFDKENTLEKLIEDLPQTVTQQSQRKPEDVIKPMLRIQYDSLIQLFIESAYLIFSCRRVGLKPKLDPILMSSSVHGFLTPTVFYQLNHEQVFKGESPTELLDEVSRFYSRLFSLYEAYFSAMVAAFDNQIDKQFEKLIEQFKSQFDCILKNKILFNNKEKEFFLCLQQTHLFQKNSTLLKIKNVSVLDLIRSNESNFQVFKNCKKKEKQLMISGSKSDHKISKEHHEQSKTLFKDLESTYCLLFKTLEKSDSQMAEETSQLQPSIRETSGVQKMRIYFKRKNTKTESFEKSLKKIIPQMIVPPELSCEQQEKKNLEKKNLDKKHLDMKNLDSSTSEFLIEYLPEKNSICVRLFTNKIIPSIENTDFLMYQSNILAFDSVNVNIEIVEFSTNSSGQGALSKKLAFKGTSCLNAKEYPLEKILLLMDSTLLTAMICEPELVCNQGIHYSVTPSHEKIEKIARKINHYQKIFLKCAEKVYSE